jgi:hypothetical protein
LSGQIIGVGQSGSDPTTKVVERLLSKLIESHRVDARSVRADSIGVEANERDDDRTERGRLTVEAEAGWRQIPSLGVPNQSDGMKSPGQGEFGGGVGQTNQLVAIDLSGEPGLRSGPEESRSGFDGQPTHKTDKPTRIRPEDVHFEP